MHRRTMGVLTRIGVIALAAGLGLRLWTHGNSAHFATGFLLGLAIVLVLAGAVGKARLEPK